MLLKQPFMRWGVYILILNPYSKYGFHFKARSFSVYSKLKSPTLMVHSKYKTCLNDLHFLKKIVCNIDRVPKNSAMHAFVMLVLLIEGRKKALSSIHTVDYIDQEIR